MPEDSLLISETSTALNGYIHHDFVFVKSEYKIIKIKLEDILFCAGMKDYTQIYVAGKNQPILTLQNLKNFLARLPAKDFVRVHRSFAVSIFHIDSISRNEIAIGKKTVPIGNSYRSDFFNIVEKYS
ncbi:LytR/AlgR family response regulator transcription factor [Agriterribacter humi]|uniref:LytR/AlgR family response regulator transcription factor n=1 Tax=Agriterribacter humi TaxID=1104781 RepID=UPI00126435A5|nr:LytTR family DNA-binding domain-containing protein [Agriterribacter humi]